MLISLEAGHLRLTAWTPENPSAAPASLIRSRVFYAQGRHDAPPFLCRQSRELTHSRFGSQISISTTTECFTTYTPAIRSRWESNVSVLLYLIVCRANLKQNSSMSSRRRPQIASKRVKSRTTSVAKWPSMPP